MFDGKRPRDLTLADLEQLIADGWPESDQLEFKERLPSRKGGSNDPWAERRELADAARNGVLEEIVAFANGHGGWLLIGVEEAKDKPGRANQLKPIADCSDLADRLHKMCRDCIDPPLPVVEIEGVETESGGTGVVVAYVPRSRTAPHRLTPSLQCYIRRHDRCEKMTMREIQDLTLNLARGDAAVREKLGGAQSRFDASMNEMFSSGKPAPSMSGRLCGFGVRASAVPVVPISIDRLEKKDHVVVPAIQLTANTGGKEARLLLPGHSVEAIPQLRGVRWTSDRQRRKNWHIERDAYRDGAINYRFIKRFEQDHEVGIFASWIMCLFANALLAIERFRRLAGTPSVEYALSLEISAIGCPFPIMGYGAERFDSWEQSGEIPQGTISFPLYSVGSFGEFTTLAALIEQDLWNAVGHERIRDFELVFDQYI